MQTPSCAAPCGSASVGRSRAQTPGRARTSRRIWLSQALPGHRLPIETPSPPPLETAGVRCRMTLARSAAGVFALNVPIEASVEIEKVNDASSMIPHSRPSHAMEAAASASAASAEAWNGGFQVAARPRQVRPNRVFARGKLKLSSRARSWSVAEASAREKAQFKYCDGAYTQHAAFLN